MTATSLGLRPDSLPTSLRSPDYSDVPYGGRTSIERIGGGDRYRDSVNDLENNGSSIPGRSSRDGNVEERYADERVGMTNGGVRSPSRHDAGEEQAGSGFGQRKTATLGPDIGPSSQRSQTYRQSRNQTQTYSQTQSQYQTLPSRQSHLTRERSPSSPSSQSRYPLASALPSASDTTASFGNAQAEVGRVSVDDLYAQHGSIPLPTNGSSAYGTRRNQSNDTAPPATSPGLGAGGRVTLPVLHLGSFSSLKLEDFSLPVPSPGSSSASPTRRSPLASQQNFLRGDQDPEQEKDMHGRMSEDRNVIGGGGAQGGSTGRLTPSLGVQEVYRSGSPLRTRSPITDEFLPAARVLNQRRRSVADNRPHGLEHDADATGREGRTPSPAGRSYTDQALRGNALDLVTDNASPLEPNGRDSNGDRPDSPAQHVSTARPPSRGSQHAGAPRRASGQSSKREPSPLGRKPYSPTHPEQAEEEDAFGVQAEEDRDDHRQAIMRESTVNRRRTIIQEVAPNNRETPRFDQRGQGHHLDGIGNGQDRRALPSGIRSRQASGNMLDMADDERLLDRRKASESSLLIGSQRTPGASRTSALGQEQRAENGGGRDENGPSVHDEPSQLPYGKLEEPIAIVDPRFRDAEVTPTKRRGLPSVPDASASRKSTMLDRRIPTSTSWQSQPMQPPRVAGVSSRKVSPMGGGNMAQRSSSYVDNISPGLDAIPGLIGEDGPYPSIARPQARQMSSSAAVLDRTSQYQDIAPARDSSDVNRKSNGAPLRVKVPPQAEEICLECMMRDRDLIHVDVSTEGVWARASDVGFHDMLDKEKMLEDQLAGSLPDEEVDQEIFETVKWRGFDWEEGETGWGLPRGFRGHLAGRLLEDRLKDQLLRFPSASAFRAKKMQKYLYDQSQLFGQAPPESVLDGDYAETSSAMPGVNALPVVPQHERSGQGRSIDQQAVRLEREVRNQVPRAAAVTMYGAPEIGHESPYPEEELKRYQSQPDMMAVQAYPGPNQRREMALRAEQSARAVTMYVQSPVTSATPSRQTSQQGYREPTSGLSQAAQLEMRKGRGTSSPGAPQIIATGGQQYNSQSAASAYANQHRKEFERGEYQGDVPSKQHPFAVWASRNGDMATYSAQSSPGLRTDHSVTSHARPGGGVFGRFNGSVTSFFGGSQGGVSGSMMDMHLGLANDRQYPPSTAHQTRSVSMASPARPRFFGRPSQDSLRNKPAKPIFLNRMRSSSSVMELASITRSSVYDTDADQDEVMTDERKGKKKGLKGFFQKLGGKGNKRKSSGSEVVGGSPRGATPREEDATLPLRPPPSLSFLVDSRVDRPLATQHGRSPSGSSLSGMAAAASAPQSASAAGSFQGGGNTEDLSQMGDARSPWSAQHRSVSAPGIVTSASRTSLLSSSPTSSRYPYGQDVRSGQPAMYGPGAGQRDSISSTLSGRRRGSGVPIHGIDEELVHDSAVEVLEQEGPRGWTEQTGPPPLQRQHRDMTSPSVSNSSGTLLPASLETPGLATNAMYGPPIAVAGSGSSYSLSNQLGQPDRQKNLPPLPPSGMAMRRDRPSPDGSPNSFDAFFGQSERYSSAPGMAHAPRNGEGNHGRQASAGQQSYQSSGQSSGSYSRGQTANGQAPHRLQNNPENPDRQAKRTKSKFGLKGLFAGGLNLNKDSQFQVQGQGGLGPSIIERQYDRSPSLDASRWMGGANLREGQPQRRVGGNAGNERYRQTYYQ